MAERSLPPDHERRDAVLAEFLSGRTTGKDAAANLASLSLENIEPSSDDLENQVSRGLGQTWGTLIIRARESPEQCRKFVELLSDMATLRPAEDANGQQLSLYGMRVWDDLPTLGWEFKNEWDGLELPEAGSLRDKKISEFLAINRLAALLLRSGTAAFSSFDGFAMVTMRAALETPIADMDAESNPLDAFLPAAAIWMSILGSEIYNWDKDFYHGPQHGGLGAGGPLWNGRHGACKERWRLWRGRFGDLASSKLLSERLKQVAEEAQGRMIETEALGM